MIPPKYDIQGRINEWQEKTFLKATAESKYQHLKKEIEEFGEAFDPEEAADCVLLIFGIAGKRGFDLMFEVERKLRICKGREWEETDEPGVYHHIEAIAETGKPV